MRIWKHLNPFILTFFLVGCSGYRVKKTENPFVLNGIASVTIPMFINRSNIQGAGPVFTREIKRALANYSGLKLYAGNNIHTDAILIGLIESPKRRADTFKTSSRTLTEGDIQSSIGERKQFYVPSSTTYSLSLRLILVKDPSQVELALLKGKLSPLIKRHPKVIFNHTLNLSGSFVREIKETLSSDSGGIVNFTKTKALFEKNLDEVAKGAALQFENEVINVF